MQRRRLNTRAITMMAMLGAIAAILMFFEISVPFTLEFVKLDFSDLPILLSGILFGPELGAVTAVIKIALKLVFKPTSTMYVGELSNLILAIAFEAIASAYYRHHRTKKGAMIGLILSTLCTSVIAIVSNWLLIFPFYVNMFHMSMDSIIKAAHVAAPWVNSELSMFMTSIFPFNIVKYGLVSLITFMIYKPLSTVIKKYIQ